MSHAGQARASTQPQRRRTQAAAARGLAARLAELGFAGDLAGYLHQRYIRQGGGAADRPRTGRALRNCAGRLSRSATAAGRSSASRLTSLGPIPDLPGRGHPVVPFGDQLFRRHLVQPIVELGHSHLPGRRSPTTAARPAASSTGRGAGPAGPGGCKNRRTPSFASPPRTRAGLTCTCTRGAPRSSPARSSATRTWASSRRSGQVLTRVQVGDRVSVPFNIACGTCRKTNGSQRVVPAVDEDEDRFFEVTDDRNSAARHRPAAG